MSFKLRWKSFGRVSRTRGSIVVKPRLHRHEADGGQIAVCLCVVVVKPRLYRRKGRQGPDRRVLFETE